MRLPFLPSVLLSLGGIVVTAPEAEAEYYGKPPAYGKPSAYGKPAVSCLAGKCFAGIRGKPAVAKVASAFCTQYITYKPVIRHTVVKAGKTVTTTSKTIIVPEEATSTVTVLDSPQGSTGASLVSFEGSRVQGPQSQSFKLSFLPSCNYQIDLPSRTPHQPPLNLSKQSTIIMSTRLQHWFPPQRRRIQRPLHRHLQRNISRLHHRLQHRTQLAPCRHKPRNQPKSHLPTLQRPRLLHLRQLH